MKHKKCVTYPTAHLGSHPWFRLKDRYRGLGSPVSRLFTLPSWQTATPFGRGRRCNYNYDHATNTICGGNEEKEGKLTIRPIGTDPNRLYRRFQLL